MLSLGMRFAEVVSFVWWCFKIQQEIDKALCSRHTHCLFLVGQRNGVKRICSFCLKRDDDHIGVREQIWGQHGKGNAWFMYRKRSKNYLVFVIAHKRQLFKGSIGSFQKCFKGSFDAYSSLENERLFAVKPLFIERWIYDGSIPYIESFNITNEQYSCKKYVSL